MAAEAWDGASWEQQLCYLNKFKKAVMAVGEVWHDISLHEAGLQLARIADISSVEEPIISNGDLAYCQITLTVERKFVFSSSTSSDLRKSSP